RQADGRSVQDRRDDELEDGAVAARGHTFKGDSHVLLGGKRLSQFQALVGRQCGRLPGSGGRGSEQDRDVIVELGFGRLLWRGRRRFGCSRTRATTGG